MAEDGVERTDEEKAASVKDEGNAKFKTNDYKGAIKSYTSSLELNSSQHLVYSNRSASYMKLGNHEEALADAQKCVELMPSWAKGYNRVASAFQGLKQWDKAIEICRAGLENSSGDGLEKLITEVNKDKFTEELLGPWHGKVDQVLGGYDQEMDFAKDGSVRIQVLGNSTGGKWWIDVDKEPKHLNIQVQPPPQPGMMMPPVPPVPYIARTDEEGLHLCCPYMKMERPKEFSGPGHCIMKKGKLAADEASAELEGLSRIEKLKLCIKEFIAMLPDTKLEEPSENDTEQANQEKVMAQVRLQSSMYEIQKRFGEEAVKEVMEASHGYGSLDARNLLEMKPLIEKLKVCGLLDVGPPPPSSLASNGPKVVGPPAESKKPVPTDKAPETTPETDSAGLDRTKARWLLARRRAAQQLHRLQPHPVAVSLVAVAAAASLAFVLWRRQRR